MDHNSILNCVIKLENQGNISKGNASEIKNCLKGLYDFSIREEIKPLKSDALPELIINNFDLEQIWQQIELKNVPQLERDTKGIKKLIKHSNKITFEPFYNNNDINEENPVNGVNEDHSVNDVNLEEKDNTVDTITDEPVDEKNSNGSSDEEENNSNVDENFFQADDMEDFLNKMEKLDNTNDKVKDVKDDEENSESEESIDLFQESDIEDDDNDKVSKYDTAKFKDFFGKSKETKVSNNDSEEDFSDEEHDSLGIGDDGYRHFKGRQMDTEIDIKSTFEKRQEKLKQKIEELEEQAVSEKPWQLKGEIRAEDRPPNALLEEFVEFDLSKRPAPVITEKTTLQLEDIIIHRIKNKAFDSVERKQKPNETPLEYKKKLLLDQEKSKVSLAHIYEQEYIKQKSALDSDNKEEEEPELHKEVRAMMTSLFSKLDALCNYHFTPKPAIPEIKVVTNLPSVAMEEVAPVAVSDGTLLAPEEVKARTKGDVIGKTERTTTDKKRERRHKKLKQKVHSKEKEKKRGQKTGKEIMKAKNVNKMKESAQAVKSSTSFFTKLEENIKTAVEKRGNRQQNKRKNEFKINKIKL